MSNSPIKAINHVTFAVRDLDRSLAFYRDVLGFDVVATWRHGAYLRVADIWLVLMCSAVREGPIKRLFTGSFKPSSIGRADTHVAFLVSGEDFGSLCERIIDSGSMVRHEQSDLGPALFFGDPDGHKLELHVSPMKERVHATRDSSYSGMVYFDEDDDDTVME